MPKIYASGPGLGTLDARYVNVTGDTMTGNLTVGTGTITSAGLLTASNGLTLTTGALNLTSTSGAAALTLTSSTTAFNVNSGLFNIDTTNSRVGIGTTAPSELLELAASSPYFKMTPTSRVPVWLASAASGFQFTSNRNPNTGVMTDGTKKGAALLFGETSGDISYFGIATSGAVTENFRLSNAGGLSLGSTYVATDPGAGNMIISGNVGIGTPSPVGKLDIVTAATNDYPTFSIRQARIATTDATATTLQTVAISASTTYLIEARIVARRTGGTAGTADDGATYIIKGAYTTKAGVVTLLGSLTIDHSTEDQAGWDATLVISGTNVIVQVTGAVNNNITWHITTMVQMVGT